MTPFRRSRTTWAPISCCTLVRSLALLLPSLLRPSTSPVLLPFEPPPLYLFILPRFGTRADSSRPSLPCLSSTTPTRANARRPRRVPPLHQELHRGLRGAGHHDPAVAGPPVRLLARGGRRGRRQQARQHRLEELAARREHRPARRPPVRLVARRPGSSGLALLAPAAACVTDAWSPPYRRRPTISPLPGPRPPRPRRSAASTRPTSRP